MTKKQYNELLTAINTINSRVDNLTLEIENLKCQKTVSTKKSSKKSTTSKKATEGKEFDRAVYEKTAKKLKVWNKAKGKVNKDDREKVYAEMRKMGYAV